MWAFITVVYKISTGTGLVGEWSFFTVTIQKSSMKTALIKRIKEWMLKRFLSRNTLDWIVYQHFLWLGIKG